MSLVIEGCPETLCVSRLYGIETRKFPLIRAPLVTSFGEGEWSKIGEFQPGFGMGVGQVGIASRERLTDTLRFFPPVIPDINVCRHNWGSIESRS